MCWICLISDGYQNNVMSMMNKVFALEYPKEYTASLSTQVSNASLVGTIFGQVIIGLTADYIGRKWSIVTLHVFNIWYYDVLLLMVKLLMECFDVDYIPWCHGFGIGAEYPSSSVTASEAANESVKRRGGAFILATNLPLSFGGPFALCIF